ncbi:thiamine-phosphate kinase [Bacillus marinisedimentorum]|uniref:thiamine-phosphate kinase n=1 Tax=Bacillus marinisedimentorum TaxID=1821260 RepID=UPI00087249D5|nr:thiamine-phosphate kinase [Bacillus marinisedimentorum]
MPISGEFSFIRSITPAQTFQRSLIQGIGDDAAVYSGSDNYSEVVCLDTMAEGIHFTRKTMNPFDLGYKALAVNISDLAAMGAEPAFYLVSAAISEDWTEDDLQEMYKGMAELGSRWQMDLIGGDTVASKSGLVLTVVVIGRVEKGKELLRSTAKPGDIVFVTGTPGDSAAGLKLLLEEPGRVYSKAEQYFIERHRRPVPRIEAGRFLAGLQRVALNDVSDGVASEANELAEASGVRIDISEMRLPASPQLEALPSNERISSILFGGEDFELIGTMSKIEWESIHDDEKLKYALHEIGTVCEADGKPAVYLHTASGETELLGKKGYNHFKNG